MATLAPSRTFARFCARSCTVRAFSRASTSYAPAAAYGNSLFWKEACSVLVGAEHNRAAGAPYTARYRLAASYAQAVLLLEPATAFFTT